MIKCAIYIRVSTEEQNIHGLSLETQKQNLIDYAREHNYEIVDIYCDGGVSARKKATKREELQRLLADIEKGLIDIVIFTKLDRWFRNISEYYKVQDILERNHVDWKTIYENYDTSTASGRLHINIMLSVAQDEADRTSERIKSVFDAKIKRGEVTTGQTPLGYKIENKRLVENPETADIVKDIFNLYLIHQSKTKVLNEIKRLHGVTLSDFTLYRTLHKEIYIGRHRGNNNYCPPLVAYEDFMEVQRITKNKNIRPTSNPDIHYLFTGLLKCANCGRTMTADCRRYSLKDGTIKSLYFYRCSGYRKMNDCSHSKIIYEKAIEKYLLEHIQDEIRQHLISEEIALTSIKPKKRTVNRSEIIKKLEKLKDLYINDIIDIELYKKDYEMYNSILESIDASDTSNKILNLKPLKDFLKLDFDSIYADLTCEERRILWRSIIDKIMIDSDNNIKIIFK